jgi:hypothetical protein
MVLCSFPKKAPTMPTTPHFPSFGLQRRHLLGGALAAGFVQLAPWSQAAAPTEGAAPSAPAASATPAPGAAAGFMALSQFLTEREDLNAQLGGRMHTALQALNAEFPAQAAALWAWVQTEQVPLEQLNQRLQADKPELAAIPAQVMQAWYLGIAGDGAKARVVAYEFALNAQTVADKLKPPTYAYGVYGSWTSNPTTFDLQRQPVHG